MDTKFNDLEKQFYADGYSLVLKAANSGFTDAALFNAIKDMYQTTDEFISSFCVYAKNQNQKRIACKKGCEWCCHQPVYALSYELDYLNNFIKTRFSNQKQKEISARAAKKRKKLEGLEKEQLVNTKYPCPLLEDGSCIAYEARPIACRIYLSMDVKSCLKFYKQPDNKTNFPALFSFPLRIGRMMNEGFKAALKTNGIVAEEFRIEEKIS